MSAEGDLRAAAIDAHWKAVTRKAILRYWMQFNQHLMEMAPLRQARWTRIRHDADSGAELIAIVASDRELELDFVPGTPPRLVVTYTKREPFRQTLEFRWGHGHIVAIDPGYETGFPRGPEKLAFDLMLSFPRKTTAPRKTATS